MYAPLITEFILYTEEMPAAYGYNGGKRALVKAAGYTDQDFDDYRKHITAVTVDGKTYSASGRGAVEIIGEDGTVKTDAEPFAGEPKADRYEITVSSTGYLDLNFVYVPAEGSQDTGRPGRQKTDRLCGFISPTAREEACTQTPGLTCTILMWKMVSLPTAGSASGPTAPWRQAGSRTRMETGITWRRKAAE